MSRLGSDKRIQKIGKVLLVGDAVVNILFDGERFLENFEDSLLKRKDERNIGKKCVKLF